MFGLIEDVSSYRTAVNSWPSSGIASVESGFAAPDGSLTAFKITINSHNDPILRHPGSITRVDSMYRFGLWLWTDSGQPFGNYQLFIIPDPEISGGHFQTSLFSLSNVPKLYELLVDSMLWDPNSADAFYMRVDPPSSPHGSDTGDYFYMWQPHVAPQRQYLDIEPDWDFQDESEKIENTHRTRSGAEYRYKWGEYGRYRFGLSFVNSAQRHTINDSFWAGDANLLFINTPGDIVKEVRLVNESKPINELHEPYSDEWRGVIELETY